jgi:MFS family permease
MPTAADSAAPSLRVSVGVLLACAMLAAALGMGLRQTSGLFLAPMTAAHAWTASGFAFAIALQVLVNGITQPLCGQVADRIGGRKVLMAGAALQAVAVAGMALSSSLPAFTFFAGIVMGVAVSAAGMPVVMASLTRLLPEAMRSRATGLGTAGSSFGQFLVVPLVAFGIEGFGWQAALLGVAAASLLIIPLALPLNDAPAPVAPGPPRRTRRRGKRSTPRSAIPPSGASSSASSCAGCTSASCPSPAGLRRLLPPARGGGRRRHQPDRAVQRRRLAHLRRAGGRWKRRELLVAIYAGRGVLIAAFMFARRPPRPCSPSRP